MKKKRPFTLTEEAVRDALDSFVSAGLLREFKDEPTACAVHKESSGATPTGARTDAKFLWRKARRRKLPRVPVKLPSGDPVPVLAGAHDHLIRQVVEALCPRWIPRGVIVYIGDAEDKFLHLQAEYLKGLGVVVPPSAKMPDVVIHDARRNWILLIEAVTSHGPINPKRRVELKHLFRNSKLPLVFVTAFLTRAAMMQYLPEISWETEVWVAESPSHLIHFNGERFLGPY